MSNAIILFAHGARDPQWAQPFVAIQNAIKRAQPGAAVELAFLEIMTPSLSDSVRALATKGHHAITIAPLFMAQGGHLKHDLPKILEQLQSLHPQLRFELLPPIGEVEPILDAIADWIIAAATHAQSPTHSQ